MGIEELRIGNLLQEHNGKHVIVDGIDDKRIRTKSDGMHWYLPNKFNPIPLNSDILEKSRFILASNHIYEYKDNSYLLFDEPDDWQNTGSYPIGISGVESNILGGFVSYGEVVIRCLYLHQLQNLFYAITGKELEIEL